MKLPMDLCKKRLAMIWFVVAAFLFLVFFLQSAFGHYGSQAAEAWGWFLPAVLPTLSLMISVLVMDALGQTSKNKTIDPFLFHLSVSLSIVYMLAVTLCIFLQPFTSTDLIKQSNLWLGPFQGLVTAALGAFYVKKEN